MKLLELLEIRVRAAEYWNDACAAVDKLHNADARMSELEAAYTQRRNRQADFDDADRNLREWLEDNANLTDLLRYLRTASSATAGKDSPT